MPQGILSGLKEQVYHWLMPPQKPPLPKGYVTTKQAAERLGLSEQAVRDLIRHDRLPARWDGRWLVREADLASFIPKPRGGQRGKRK